MATNKKETLYITVGTVANGVYVKQYNCSACKQSISTCLQPSIAVCPHCGAMLDGVVKDTFAEKVKKFIGSLKGKRTKLIKNVNGSNYFETTEKVTKLDREIKEAESTLVSWNALKLPSQLPYNFVESMRNNLE